MCLNIDKCKIVDIPGNKTDKRTPPVVTIKTEALEYVNSYKYLGLDLSTDINTGQQWQRIKPRCSSAQFLLKRLKTLGFKREILVTIYRSIGLQSTDLQSTPYLCKKSQNQARNATNTP